MSSRLFVVLVLSLVLGLTLTNIGMAEETTVAPAAPAAASAPEVAAPPAAAQEEEPEYSFGTVKTTGTDQIVVTEFDYDTGDELDVAYAIDPNIELHNVTTLKEIAQGDEVDIDYLEKDGKKVAVVISVAKGLDAEAED